MTGGCGSVKKVLFSMVCVLLLTVVTLLGELVASESGNVGEGVSTEDGVGI